MSRLRLTDPDVKQRLQNMQAAGMSKETIAADLGIARQTLYAWLEQISGEMQAAVVAGKADYAARLTERQFRLYDELADKARGLSEEIDQLRDMQRATPTPQTAAVIFRGYSVVQSYLEKMGELLGQLQPAQQANIHLTRIEQLLNVTMPVDRIPTELRAVVMAGGHSDDSART